MGVTEPSVKADEPFESGGVVIYETMSSGAVVEVRSDGDTVWLNRRQMARLFDRDVKTIGKHIANALGEELAGFSVVAKFATTASDGKTYQVEHYSLDVILAVGYRVKSPEGVRFRQWATDVLRRYLIEGAAVNRSRLDKIGKIVNILARSGDGIVAGLAGVLDSFSVGLNLLDAYDRRTLTKPVGSASEWTLGYAEAREVIEAMRPEQSGGLFGLERGEAFRGIVEGLHQSFGGVEMYPGIQEKAANLLYLTVKDHPFADGNKRIAAALFVYFLERNNALHDGAGAVLIDSNALAAVTLMIALSKPEEKELMCLLVMNMICAGGSGPSLGR